MATQAQVNIVLNGNSAGLSAALKGANRDLLSFKNTLKGGFVGAFGALSGAALFSRLTGSIQEAKTLAGQLADAARAANLNAEAFQVLSRLAKQSGSDVGAVTKALVAMNEKAREAVGGDAGASRAFAQLTIDARAFIELAPERQMEALGKALVRASDPAAAFSATMQILGTKNAPQLRAVLEDLGTRGFDPLAADMVRNGLLMRQDVVAALDELGDASEDTRTRYVNAMAEVAAQNQKFLQDLKEIEGAAFKVGAKSVYGLTLISDALAVIGAGFRDTFTHGFQGMDFYVGQLDQLWNARIDRHEGKAPPGPAGGGSRKNPPGGINLGAGVDAQASMKEISDAIETRQAIDRDKLAAIARDFGLTNEQRQKATADILFAQALAINAAKRQLDDVIAKLAEADPDFKNYAGDRLQIARELAKKPSADRNLGAALGARDQLHNLEADVGQSYLDARADPKTATQGLSAGLADLQTRFGTIASQVRTAISDIGGAFTGSIAQGLQGLIDRTMSWGDALRNIGGSIMGSVIASFSRMVAEIVVGEYVVAGVRKMLGLQEARETKKATGEKMVEGGAKSIAQLGPIWGPLAFAASIAAIIGLSKGFFDGGFTGLGNPRDPAGVVHRGEFVIPHDVTAAVGPSALGGLVESVRSGSSLAMSSPAFTNAAGGDEYVKESRTLIVDYRERDLIDRLTSDSRYKTKVTNLYLRNNAQFGQHAT